MNKAKLTSLCHKVRKEVGLSFNSVMLYYFLESILEKNFTKDAKEILETLKMIASLNQELLFEKLPSRCNFFVSLETKKEKQKEKAG